MGAAILVALGVTAGPAAGTTPGEQSGPVTHLVPPTGHHRIGTVRLHLVDPTRIDPTSPTHGVRELMVQVWYAAASTRDHPVAPYLPPLAAANFEAALTTELNAPRGTRLPATSAHVGAPADRQHGPRPVLLYSPGGNADGSFDTALVEDLVGHGYTVVTLDDTNESHEVEFPGGRLVTGTFPLDTREQITEGQQLRAADARFVLNALSVLNKGGNPDAEHAALPNGLAGSLDLDRVGMFGWSLGGAASAQTMHDDPRIKAAVNMDGTFYGPLAQQGVTGPFLLMTASDHPTDDLSLASFLGASTGPKFHLDLANSAHNTFSDLEEVESELAPVLGWTPEQVKDEIGTIDPTTAVTDERVYLRAFFDRYLRNRDNHLLDGPSRRFPDITFEP